MSSELFKAIKNIFSAEVEVVVDSTFADAKTDKGVILKITPKIEEKAKVEVISEDGSTAPAPAGSHTLDDGTVIEIDADGNIAKITDKVEEEKEKVDEKMEDVEKEKEPGKDVDIEARLSNLEKAVAMLVEGLNKESEMKKVEIAKQADAEVAKLKAESDKKELELSRLQKELKKFKAAPTVQFKQNVTVETKTKPEDVSKLTPMQIRLRKITDNK